MPRKGASTVSAAQMLVERINGQMKGNVLTLGSNPVFGVRRIPTGSLVLDRLLGGGFARGRHHEIFGDWSSTKSLTAYRTMALAQARGETAALVDAENAFNSGWFEQLGGIASELALYPDRSETGDSKRDANELGNVLRTLIQRGEGIVPADVVTIDSVASLLPSEELEHDLEDGDPRVASLARLMPLLLRMLTTMNGQTTFLWINQWRDKIGRIPGLKSTPGGRALGFFASTRIEMAEGPKETIEREGVKDGKIVKRKVVRGRTITCTLSKEKTGARPLASRSFFLDMDTRMPDQTRELIDLGVEDGLIEFRGNRYYTEDGDGKTYNAHGLNQLASLLEREEDLRSFLTALVQERTEAGAVD